MRRIMKMTVVAVGVLAMTVMACFGADTPPGGADPAGGALSPWAALIPLVVPMAVAGIKVVIPKIPKALIPIICPVLGAVIEIIGHFTGLASGGTLIAIILGAAGVFVREVFDQIRKAGMSAASVMLAAFLALAATLQTGCATVEAGNSAAIVNAERIHASSVETINFFLKLEYQNRALLEQVSPDIHKVANDLRILCPPLFLNTWDAIQQFKALRTIEAKAEMDAKLAELQSAAAQAQSGTTAIKQAQK